MAQKKSHFGIGMAVGAVAGAVAGLFLAPKAGKELREDAMKMYKKLHTEDPKAVSYTHLDVYKRQVLMYRC